MATFGLIRVGTIFRLALVFASWFFFISSAAIAQTAATGSGAGIVTYILENRPGGLEKNVPVTFGAVFVNGDVPAGTQIVAQDRSGARIPLQVDRKASNRDGSLRHAVLTLTLPNFPTGTEYPVTLLRGSAASAAPVDVSALPNNFDAVVTLTSGNIPLTVSARTLLAAGKIETWLSGPQVTEWWVSGPLHDAGGKPDQHLTARFGIRSYGAGRPLRIEVDIENDWTWVSGPRTEFYDANVKIGGKDSFAKAGVIQPAQTRWRKIFWWNTPVEAVVKPNLAYMEKTRIVPNYDPDAVIREDRIAQLYRRFTNSDRGPLGPGLITPYMPTTGGRADIGPLPEWTSLYLLTGDRRVEEMTMSSGDLSGSFPSHYRNEKVGRPSTTEDFPNISTNSNLIGEPGNLQREETNGQKKLLVPDPAHEPSLDFIPYVLTGDRYYLEELEFWAQWNSWGTAAESHGFKESLVTWDQVRAQAWSLRTLTQAAFIVPDSDPLKDVVARQLKANFAWYDATYTENPKANALHLIFRPVPRREDISPFEDDFLTWAANYAVQLGFDEARNFAKWKAVFPVERMINKDYCWVLATPYRIEVQNPDLSVVASWSDLYRYTFARWAKNQADPKAVPCGSQQMANALGLKTAGEILTGSRDPDGYPSNMQPALAAAIDLDVPGAKEAWRKFQARPVKPDGGMDPMWAILPWSF